ncbi:hypothetical protein C8R46DRAFT_1212831 [Mycena filopes]|nr:hypothetical protein C8R46DRAFT_1212831 [Mycena filopes]
MPPTTPPTPVTPPHTLPSAWPGTNTAEVVDCLDGLATFIAQQRAIVASAESDIRTLRQVKPEDLSPGNPEKLAVQWLTSLKLNAPAFRLSERIAELGGSSSELEIEGRIDFDLFAHKDPGPLQRLALAARTAHAAREGVFPPSAPTTTSTAGARVANPASTSAPTSTSHIPPPVTDRNTPATTTPASVNQAPALSKYQRIVRAARKRILDPVYAEQGLDINEKYTEEEHRKPQKKAKNPDSATDGDTDTGATVPLRLHVTRQVTAAARAKAAGDRGEDEDAAVSTSASVGAHATSAFASGETRTRQKRAESTTVGGVRRSSRLAASALSATTAVDVGTETTAAVLKPEEEEKERGVEASAKMEGGSLVLEGAGEEGRVRLKLRGPLRGAGDGDSVDSSNEDSAHKDDEDAVRSIPGPAQHPPPGVSVLGKRQRAHAEDADAGGARAPEEGKEQKVVIRIPVRVGTCRASVSVVPVAPTSTKDTTLALPSTKLGAQTSLVSPSTPTPTPTPSPPLQLPPRRVTQARTRTRGRNGDGNENKNGEEVVRPTTLNAQTSSPSLQLPPRTRTLARTRTRTMRSANENEKEQEVVGKDKGKADRL